MKRKSLLGLVCGFGLLTIGSIAGLVSCEVGLGEAVDVQAPVLSITNPPTSAIIRDTFAITGDWSDDGSIKKISVKLRNTQSGVTYTYDGSYQQDEDSKEAQGKWNCIIDPSETGKLIKDGKYEATITILDNGGHSTVSSRSFTIDNTPPIIVLQRPSTKAQDEDSDVFGQTFSLTGQAADDNNIFLLRVIIYSDPECTQEIHHVDLKNVPPTISLDVAKFVLNQENDYSKIYGSATKDGKKPFYCSIIAYDEAKRYPEAGKEKADDTMGNSVDSYYLYNDIGDILADFKLTELYSIMNGTFTETDSSREVDSSTIPALLNNKAITNGRFSLNPANNPEFKVVGRDGITKDASAFENPANNLANGEQISLKVDVGLDAIPLVKDSLKPYLLAWDSAANDFVENKIENRIYPKLGDKPYEVSGTGYTFTTKIDGNDCYDYQGNKVQLTVGNGYFIAMEGKDSKNNEVVAEDGKIFGFKLAPSGAAPIADIKTCVNPGTGENATTNNFIDDSMVYVPRYKPGVTPQTESVIRFAGNITVEDGTPTVQMKIGNGEAQSITLTPTGEKGVFSMTKDVPVSALANPDKAGQHNVVFTISQTQTTKVTKSIMYQPDAPSVTLSRVEPTAYNYTDETSVAEKVTLNGVEQTKKYLNGKNVKLNVTIIAGAVGLNEKDDDKKAKIEFIQGGVVKKTIPSPTFGTTSAIDTTEFDEDEVLIRITAYDMAGNKTVCEETYYVDQATDTPVILPKNSANSTLNMTQAQAQSLENTTKNVYSANQTVAYKLIDDDGLDKVEYTIIKASDLSIYKPTTTTALNGTTDYQVDITMPETPGTYKIILYTNDINSVNSTGSEQKQNSKEFFIRVTASAPVIESVNLQSTTVNGTATINPTVLIKSDQLPFVLVRVVKNKTTNQIVNGYSEIYTHDGNPYIIKESVKDLLETKYGFDSQNPIDTIQITDLNSESPEIEDQISMNSITASGKYVVSYVVIDKNDKYGEATKDITVDLHAPKITKLEVAGADYDANKWYGSKTLALAVTAADIVGETGISAVEYSTNGTTWTALSYDNSTAVYAGSAVFNSEGALNDLYIRAKDIAGNITYFDGTTANGTQTSAKINVKIDTSAPVLKVLKYKVGALAEKDIDTSKIYVKNGVKLMLSGTYVDAQSDIDKDTLSFAFGTMPAPTITKNDASWTAEYTIDSTKTLGDLTVKIKNKAGVETEITPFEVIVDTQYPEISNISLTTSSTTNFVYKKNATEYYVNNTEGNPKFTISGISKDNTGIAKVNLYVGDSTTPVEKTTSDFAFDELDWKDEPTDLTVKITATDIAGNENPVTGVDDKYKAVILTIHFDTTPPAAKHWADTSDKDIYFRIGNADNDKDKTDSTKWETGDDVGDGTTDADKKNKDVGKKYSYGSWGTDSSIEIRGTFDETGSGLKAIHYAIFDTEPDATMIEKLVKGTLVKTDSHVLNVSSFAPLASNETRKVPYSTTSGRSAEEVTSNFRESIPGFNVEENYLVLVAEDNVGNRKADALARTDGSTNLNNAWNSSKSYYKMNKDNTPPEITSVTGAETTKDTNVALTVNINEKNPSYLDVVIKKDGTALAGNSQKPTIGAITGADSTYTSTVTIPFASGITTDGTYDVEIKVVDKAGNISAAVTKKIIRDNVAPAISFTQPDAASDVYIKSSNYTFKGTITETGSGIDEVKATLYKVDGSTEIQVGEPETIYPNANGEWEWQRYDLDAKYKVKIQAKDKAGNTTNDESNSVNIDAKNPTVTVKGSGLKDADGNDVAETTALSNGVTYYAKGNYPIIVTVDDINFDYDSTPALYTVTGKNINDSNATHAVTITKTSAKAFKFYPSTYVDGTFSYTIDVKDKAGNQADRIVIKVQRDTTGPTVTIKNPTTNITNYTNALDDESYTFRINATDGAGVGVAKLSYAFSTNSSAPATTEWKEIDFSDGDYNIDIPLKAGQTPVRETENGVVTQLCEGIWYLYAKAADKSGNKTATTQKRQIHIDKSAPALALIGTSASLVENSTNVLSGEVTNNKYKLTGTVSDTNALASSNSLIIKIDGVQSTITPSSGTWTKEIATGTTNGTLKSDKSVEIELIATDVADKKTSKKYYLYYDTKAPVLTVTAPASTESVETQKKVIKGTVSDDGYGINKVEYTLYKGKVTASTPNPVAVKYNNKDVNSTNFPIEVKGEQWSITDTTGMPLGTDEGELTLKVTATENANGSYGGRTTTDYVSFYYDKNDPNLTETGIDTTGKTLNAAFTLTGKVWDTNAIKSITVTCGDKTWVSGTDSNVSITANTSTAPYAPSSNNWTASFVVGSTSNPNNISDGTNLFTVVAEDIAGKKVQLSRTVIVDIENPTLGAPTVSTTASNSWYKTRTLELSGTISDADPSSGVSKVEASADGTNWTPLSINGTNYSGSITFSADGSSKQIQVRATDVAGNSSTKTKTGIQIDTVAPALTEDTTELKVNGKDATKSIISFDVTEANSGIQASGFKVYLGNSTTPLTLTSAAATGNANTTNNLIVIGTATGSGTNKKYPVTIQIGTSAFTNLSGSKTVKVTVTDKAGNPSSPTIVRNINVDPDAPVTTITSPLPDDTVNKTITLSGRITDVSNIKSIALTATSGSNTVQFAYPAASGKGTITYENGQWSTELDTTQLYNGTSTQEMTLSITATDEADNTSTAVTQSLTIDQNSDRPVVKFTNIVREGTGANAKYILKYGNNAALEGTLTDDDAISTAVVQVFKASSSAITSEDADTTGTTTFNAATGDFTFTPASAADGEKQVYFYIKDNNDNEFYTQTIPAWVKETNYVADAIVIYQDKYYKCKTAHKSGDTFAPANWEEDICTKLILPWQQYKTETAVDNNDVLKYNSDSNAPLINSVQLQAYTAATANMVTQEGNQVDTTKNGGLTSLGANCVVGGTSKNYIDLTVSAKDANGIKGIVIKVEQGSTTTYYRSNNSVKFSESETGVTYTDTKTIAATTNDSSNHVYTTSRINITDYVNGEVTVTVKVYDNSGLYNNQESKFVIDRSAPTLSIDNNVAEGSVVYGINKITIGGSVTATDVEKIYYAVTAGTVESSAIADNTWIEVENQKISASIIFGGSDSDAANGKISDSLRKWIQTVYNYNDTYMTEHDENKLLSIHFKAVDACGNAGYSKRTVSVVPNGDKPVITLAYPIDKALNVHPSLAGTIRIYGNAEVITGSVSAVYVQIDTNYNGTFNATDWKTGFDNCINGKNTSYTVESFRAADATNGITGDTIKGIKATGTLNWNLPINGNKEFNPAAGSKPETRRVAIRIYGVGGSGKVSEPVTQEFTIDPNAPHIGGTGLDTGVMQLKLVQFNSTNPLTAGMTYAQAQAAISNQMPYIPGQTTWVKGQWYIAASVYDDSGINSIKLDENISGINPIYLVKATKDGDPGTIQTNLQITTSQTEKTIFVKANDCKTAINNVAGKNNFDIYIPLPTSAGSGTVEFTLEAVEASEFNNGSTETVKVNFDNTPPKLGTIGHDNYNASAYNVRQDNGFYRIFGYATDTDASNLVSDMKAVAFYFVRRGSANTRVYDPMWKNKYVAIDGTDNTKTITYEYGMFWNTKTVGRVADLSKLTLTAKDDNIHAGGFVLIEGTIYTIREVSSDGLTITLKTEAPANITTAKFAYAMVIDNFNMTESTDGRQKETDSTKYGYGYYKKDLTADDGDLMREKWANGQWEAWINSANIPDGPIEIHYVAIDNAQNYSVGIVGNVPYSTTDDESPAYNKFTTLDVSGNGDKATAENNLISGFDYIYDADKKAYVSNNSPRIAGVKVGCDYDGNGTISDTEKTTKYVATETIYGSGGTSTIEITDIVSEFEASKNGGPLMTVKDKISVELEIIGGNGNLYNQYNIDTTKKEHKNISSWSKFNNLTYYTDEALTTEVTSTTEDDATVYTKEFFRWSDVKNQTDATNKYYTDAALTTKATTSTDNDAIVYAKVSSEWQATNGRLGNIIRNENEGKDGDYYTASTLPSINFTNDQLVKAVGGATNGNNGTRWFTIDIWDSTEETTPYDNSQYATLKLPLDVQVLDKTDPNTFINDLYWNSSTDNSVFKNPTTRKLDGHIELKDYLGTGFTAANYGTDDDKISGKVVFRGYAYDNKRLSRLTWGIKDNLSGTIKEAWPRGYITDATYDSSTATWTNAGRADIGNPYYYLKIYDDAAHGAYLNENGHRIYWELTIDTSYVQEPGESDDPGWAVGKDLYVYVKATDSSNRTTNMNPTNVMTGADSAILRPNYKVDVVPYITGIKSRLDYNRSSNGRYQIADKETGLQLLGYNLSKDNQPITLTVPDSSGYYVETLHGCPTINNMNNNAAVGTTPEDEQTYVENKYNYQPDTYNDSLTDDVYIQLWQFNNRAAQTNTGVGFIREPAMAFNPVNGQVGFAFSNGANKFSMAMGKNHDDTVTQKSYQYWEMNYAKYVCNALSFDESGHSHGISVGIDTEPNSGKAGRMNYFYSSWGVSAYGQGGNFDNNTNSLHIDTIGVPNANDYTDDGPTTAGDWSSTVIVEERFSSASIASVNHDNNPTVYIAYYDDVLERIVFRWGTVTDTDAPAKDYDRRGNPTNNTVAGYNNLTTTTEGTHSFPITQYSLIAGGKNVAGTTALTPYNAGEYVNLAVVKGSSTTNDVVCVVWYDAIHDRLMYNYKKDPCNNRNADSTHTTTSGYWAEAKVLKEKCGQYCKIAVDANGGIHIAAYDSGNKGVGYVYLPAYNSAYSEANNYYIIDAMNGPFDELGIAVAVDGTGNTGKAYPTISYYANGTPKMATYSTGIVKGTANKPEKSWENGKFTGNWDVCYVPTNSQLLKDHINVVQPQGTNGVRARVSTTNNFATEGAKENGTVTGNTTTNPILGYAIREGSKGYLEIAQRK